MTDLGPMASPKAFERIGEHIADAVAQGARVVTGGRTWHEARTGLSGWEPAVLVGARATMDIVAEETFGPVFPVVTYEDDDELWPMVEACRYGLNASIFGPDGADHVAWLSSRHRNVYVNATPFDLDQLETRIVDGGYGGSALHGEPVGTSYRWRHGPRRLAQTLTQLSADEP